MSVGKTPTQLWGSMVGSSSSNVRAKVKTSFTQWSPLVRFRKTQHGTQRHHGDLSHTSMSSMFSPSNVWNRQKQVDRLHVAFIYTADVQAAISDRQWLKYNHCNHYNHKICIDTFQQVPLTAPGLFIVFNSSPLMSFFLPSSTAIVFLFSFILFASHNLFICSQFLWCDVIFLLSVTLLLISISVKCLRAPCAHFLIYFIYIYIYFIFILFFVEK